MTSSERQTFVSVSVSVAVFLFLTCQVNATTDRRTREDHLKGSFPSSDLEDPKVTGSRSAEGSELDEGIWKEIKVEANRSAGNSASDSIDPESVRWKRLENRTTKPGTVEGKERSRRAVGGGGGGGGGGETNRSVFSGVSVEKEKQLNVLAKKDLMAAVFEFIDLAETMTTTTTTTTTNCTLLRLNYDVLSSLIQPSKALRDQTIKAIQAANTLNNILRNPPAAAAAGEGEGEAGPLPERLFVALIEGLVQSDRRIHGAAIAFDPGQMPDPRRPIAPYIQRSSSTDARVFQVRNVTWESRNRYAVNGTEGYEWFWKQRKDFSSLLWHHRDVCKKVKVGGGGGVSDLETAVSSMAEGLWGSVQFDGCLSARTWTIAYSVPFFGCDAQMLLVFKGVLKIDIDLGQLEFNQCNNEGQRSILPRPTHHCPPTTQCVSLERLGFRRGGYHCHCQPGYYLPASATTSSNHSSRHNYFSGSQMESIYVTRLLLGLSSSSSGDGLPEEQVEEWEEKKEEDELRCEPCPPGCVTCEDDRPCSAENDVIVRSIPLVIESLCISFDVILLVVIVWMKKAKIRRAYLWCLVEATIIGSTLIHSTVVVQYFEPTELTCFLVPWLRELGFSVIYGALTLRVYRVLTEFQSRKAHRVQVKDNDLLKYLWCIVVVVVGYLVAWSALTIDDLRSQGTLLEVGSVEPHQLRFVVCQSRWWDYSAETAELVFLGVAVYQCYCARSAPSEFHEVQFISLAILNEVFVSLFFNIARHCLWLSIHSDHLFVMYFIRCQLTMSGMHLLVLGPKFWYSYRPPVAGGGDEALRPPPPLPPPRPYTSSDGGGQQQLQQQQQQQQPDSVRSPSSAAAEIVKLNNVGSNGEVDVEDMNLSEMNPDDIRNELKRLYTQLQIYKTKTMRQDNPHISKRRGGRKQTNRRFSFQPFQNRNKQPHASSGAVGGGGGAGGGSGGSGGNHPPGGEGTEVSRTPEDSSNSVEGVSVYMDECSATDSRSPPPPPPPSQSSSSGVTFKPSRKSKYSS